MKTMFFTGKIC